MSLHQILFYSIDVTGTVAFAISGTMTGLKHRLDLFGVIFIAVTTALGGGVIRDVIIGYIPPMMFRNYQYVLMASVTAVILFCAAYFLKGSFFAWESHIDVWANVFDALGLGSFVVSGMQAGIEAGYVDNGFFLVFLGLLSGIGGGVMRDLFVHRRPLVLVKHIYAVAAIAGGCLYWFLIVYLKVADLLSTGIVITVVFVIRMLATKYRWNLPHVE